MRELKAEKVRDMTVDEIENRIRGQLQNPVLIRERRRDIARMRTILVEHRTGKRKLSGHGDTPQAGAAVAAREPAKAAKAAKAVKEPKRETTERKRAPKEAKKAAKEPKK